MVTKMDHAIEILICVDNDAFGTTYDDQAQELGRILREAADNICANPNYINPCSGIMLCLNDANGRRVGSVTPTILDIG